MIAVGDDRNPLAQRYPTVRVRHACRPLRHRQRSSRRRWGRRPGPKSQHHVLIDSNSCDPGEVTASMGAATVDHVFFFFFFFFCLHVVGRRANLREGAFGENTEDGGRVSMGPCGQSSRLLAKGSRLSTHISKQVLPQAPSPTMTSLRRSSAMVKDRIGRL